jgi:transposase-like protein
MKQMKQVMMSRKSVPLAAPERKGGERSEPDWSEGAAPPSAMGPQPLVSLAQAPGPEVVERPVRRRFTAEYKRAVLKEVDRCSAGEIGALLRREGLYSSHLTAWRRQRESGELEALSPKKRGRKAKPVSPLAKENERLKRENEALGRRLAHAELLIEVQKKIAGLLGIPLNPSENGGSG